LVLIEEYLFILREFIPPIIKRIPPAQIIHLSILVKNVGTFIKLNPKFIKYSPNTKYIRKNMNAPPLAITKGKKRYI